MCGIAGIMYRDMARPIDRAVLKGMGDAIAHRGPDGEGFFQEPGIGLVHRRLSIIDLAGGDQPIGNEDGTIQIVQNGEIYNYRELRRDLESHGHQFRTQSDTEVMVHLYEEMGAEFVNRLRGMFAFAVWDRPRRRLLIGRDRLGIKPLYIYRDAEKLAFASELKGILAIAGIPREVDPVALDDYLAFGVVPGARSIFRGIEKLLPAHVLTVEPNFWNQSPQRYWRLQFVPDESPSQEDWCEKIRCKVDEAVRAHLVADVPVGAFLSGGVDSAVVLGSGIKSAAGEIKTFSIGFEDESFSELPAARAAAQYYGTQHVDQVVNADAASLLDQLTFHFDEPFADTSAIPTYLLSKLASQSVKVALSGDGGDEAFGGYARYAHDVREAQIRRLLPDWVQRGLAPIANVWPKTDWLPRPLRAKTFLTNLSLDAGSAYANTLQICRTPMRRRLLSDEVLTQLNGHRPEELICRAYSDAPPRDALSGMISADIAALLPDDYLVKVDRASMAHGLEVRPPLLDHELLELSAQLPSRWKVSSGQTKRLFKTAFVDRLPHGTIGRKKQGFEVPIDDWLRGPLRDTFEQKALGSGNRIGSLINQAAARKLYESHISRSGQHGATLWSLLVLAQWCERYLPTA